VLRFEEDLGGARFALTDRVGGASAEPYAELNLAFHVGDDPRAVEENRKLAAARIGLPPDRIVFMNQVHGGEVAVVDGVSPPWPPAVDGLVTGTAGVALAALVADCVPVLLADPHAGVVGVAHAGRRGLTAGVVPAVVGAMRQAGARTILARVGPAVCGRCYEVPEQMRAAVSSTEPAAWSRSKTGSAALDVAAGVIEQLLRHGVKVSRIEGCTVEDSSLYSYRRDRTTGRFAGLAWRSVPGQGR
jgi:purine-nucleoside/S-methyl-5'-thioadenosine phosphorylase / adenosine deaminase